VVNRNLENSQYATAVGFTVKCFNPIKLYLLSENIIIRNLLYQKKVMLRKQPALYFSFIHKHFIKY